MAVWKFLSAVALVLLFCDTSTPTRNVAPNDPAFVSAVERDMAQTLRDYIVSEKDKLELIKEYVNILENRSKEHAREADTNPFHVYQSVQKLIKEWETKKQSIMEERMNFTFPIEPEGAAHNQLSLPSDHSAEEIIAAIFRIQDTYSMTPKDIIGQHADKSKALASNCYGIGMHAFKKFDYYHALMWFLEAESRLRNEEEPSINQTKLLPPLAQSAMEQGNSIHAHRFVARLNHLENISEEEIKAVVSEFPKLAEAIELTKFYDEDTISDEDPDWKNERELVKMQLEYEKLCRGEIERAQTQFTDPSAKCYYKRTTPFLFLAPAKVEVLNEEPLVAIYRNAVSDDETKRLYELAEMGLHYASVVQEGKQSTSKHRLSSVSWLDKENHEVVSALSKRVSEFTGLSLEHAEPFQVNRYGFGGHFSLHHDNVANEERELYGYHSFYNSRSGDRVATFMFYLSDVEGGGATVFPEINITIFPTKNDAVFWYNLKKSGSGIDEMLHSGCPLMSGVKWVANQWLKEYPQTFLRGCGLTEDE